MQALYHLTIPRPTEPRLDAVVQEVQALSAHLGGDVIYVKPARRPGSRFPERLYGLHCLPYLWLRERRLDLHHIYNAHPFVFPYLRLLRQPIVYTITAGLRSTARPRQLDALAGLARIVVSNTRHLKLLQSWGLNNVALVPPGIDTTRFTPQPAPALTGLTLLMASAPWTLEQFESKGINALLEAARLCSDLRLIFLWRGLHADEMQRRMAQSGLGERAVLINQHVDVNAWLAGVHAAIVLARDETLVKAFPHSLLEALAAGRPVLISRAIPMADYIEQTGCGVVVEQVEAGAILAAIEKLADDYPRRQQIAAQVGQTFSFERLRQAYEQIYGEVLNQKRRTTTGK